MGHSSSRREDPLITDIRNKLKSNIATWLMSFIDYREGNLPVLGSLPMSRTVEVTIPDFAHNLRDMNSHEIGAHIMAQKPHDEITLSLKCVTDHADWMKQLRVTNLEVTAYHSRDIFSILITYDIYRLYNRRNASNLPPEWVQADHEMRAALEEGKNALKDLQSQPADAPISDDSSSDDSSSDDSNASRRRRNADRALRRAARSAGLSVAPVPDEEVIRKPSLVIEGRPPLVDMTCKICFEKSCNVVMHPCGHIAACSDCIKQNDSKCPLCRKKITSMTQIFIS